MISEKDFRNRLLAISAASIVLTLGNTAWDVLGPLWISGQLHLGAADWAHIRSLRFTGTLLGTFFLGIAANAWGPRALGIACFLIAAASLGIMAAGGEAAIYLAIPFFGASISAVYVALNIMTQLVGPERQARANSLYRIVSAAVAVVAPVAATGLAAFVGHTWALLGFALVLALGGLCLLAHPAVGANPSGRALLANVLGVIKRPGLVKFLLIEQGFALSTTGVGVFTALRLSKDFGSPDTLVGTFMTVAALAGFLGTMISYPVLERLGIKRTLLFGFAAMGLAWTGFGLAPLRELALASLVVGNLSSGIMSAPVSYTVARLGGSGSEAFSVTLWKLVQAFAAVIGMNLCAILEPSIGMAGIIAWGGLASLLPVAVLALGRIRLAD
jgi:predicted MFS family arabinose efflux permease